MTENGEELTQIRCTYCTRFLGYEMMEDGILFLFCSSCKHWNEIVTPFFQSPLTTEQIYAILNKRTKGH